MPNPDKYDLFELGKWRAIDMCNANLVIPPFIRTSSAMRLTGLYDGDVWVNLERTSPLATNRYVWSYPGYKIDRTAHGIILHEVGHHFDVKHRYPSKSREWSMIVDCEDPITNSEPTPSEAFAEAFRLYSSNPKLLAVARPLRYDFLMSIALPVEERPWLVVLRDAPDHVKNAAVRWAG